MRDDLSTLSTTMRFMPHLLLMVWVNSPLELGVTVLPFTLRLDR